MSKVKIVGDSYTGLSVTVDGVEIPCIAIDIKIDHKSGIVANLTVPAEVDIIPIKVGFKREAAPEQCDDCDCSDCLPR